MHGTESKNLPYTGTIFSRAENKRPSLCCYAAAAGFKHLLRWKTEGPQFLELFASFRPLLGLGSLFRCPFVNIWSTVFGWFPLCGSSFVLCCGHHRFGSYDFHIPTYLPNLRCLAYVASRSLNSR